MFEMRKLFSREVKPAMPTGMDHADVSLDEIRDEFRACILEVMASARIDRACFQLDLHRSGTAKDGRPVVNANLRLVHWERVSGVRLLVGLPILERGVRRAIASSWSSSAAHFGGLWLHPSGQILERNLMKELGRDLEMLEHAAPCLHIDDSAWSGHPEVERKATDWGGL